MHFTWLDIFNINVAGLIHLNFASILAFIGSLFYVPSFYMKTIMPLRVAGIVGNFFFLALRMPVPALRASRMRASTALSVRARPIGLPDFLPDLVPLTRARAIPARTRS